MRIGNTLEQYQRYKSTAKTTSNNFAEMMSRKEGLQNNNATGSLSNSGSNNIIIKLGALCVGGDGRGAYFNMEYAENSTDENPIILAEGVDEFGRAFKININVNEVNPYSATYLEMRALSAHIKAPTFGSSGAMASGGHSYVNKENYVDHFAKVIEGHDILGQFISIKRDTDLLNMYLDYYESHRKS